MDDYTYTVPVYERWRLLRYVDVVAPAGYLAEWLVACDLAAGEYVPSFSAVRLARQVRSESERVRSRTVASAPTTATAA